MLSNIKDILSITQVVMLTTLVVSLIYLLTILIIFLIKKKVKSFDTVIYKRIIFINLASLLLELSLYFIAIEAYNNDGILLRIFLFMSKVFTVFICLWFYEMYKYTRNLYYKHNSNVKNNNYDIKFRFTLIIAIILTLILPTEFIVENSIGYTSGPSTRFVGLVMVLLCFSMVYYLVKSRKFIDNKEFVPIFLSVLALFIVIGVQMTNPTLLLFNPILTLVTIVMYHTIENPDAKMARQLELAKEQSEKANRAKTDFLSSMSHEIRTPLNAIVGFSNEIMDSNTLEDAKENAKDIVNASGTLLEIVNGILDISKIEAGKIEIVNSPYNSHEVFDELGVLITPKMREKGLDFTYKIAPDIPDTLYGDHANIKKIVTNLLSNACKYTDHGFVHYEVNCVNDRAYSKLIITVEDSGRGIKKENLDKLFNKFQRIEEDRNTTIEGTGLGLAITKQLVELMGGRIIVHTVYGEGSKFTVIINQRIEKEQVTERHKVLDTLDLTDIRILLVDDNELNIKVANKILQKYKANDITSVRSGFECLDKINAGEKYDVILLDDMMPKMSGVETLKELKKINGFNTPVIALTANAITGMREKYLNEGFNDYLAKPIEREQLIKVMNETLGRTITNQIPVEKIGEEIGEKSEEEIKQEEEKNRIIQVSEDDIDLIKNQKLVSESNKFKIVDEGLDKVVSSDTEELDEEKVDNVIDVPTDLLNSTQDKIAIPEVVEPPEIDPKEYLESRGVDVNSALENLGDMEMYNDTVNDYLSEVEDKWQRIEDYKLQGNMSDYAIEVHSLKSDSRYLGLNKLADLAYQHELASKENNIDFVNNNFATLEEEYQKALDILKNYKDNNLK